MTWPPLDADLADGAARDLVVVRSDDADLAVQRGAAGGPAVHRVLVVGEGSSSVAQGESSVMP